MKIWKVLPFVTLVGAAIFTQSCSSDPVVTPKVYGKLMAIHAAEGAPKVAVGVDGATVTTTDSLAYATATSYVDILSNATKRIVQIFAGSTAVLTDSATYNAIKYTMIAYRDSGSTKPLRLTRAFPDDTTAPAAGKMHLRVANFSPDAPGLDLVASAPGQANGTALLSNLTFKKIVSDGSFTFTPSANGTYDLKIRVSGTTTFPAPSANISSKILTEGKLYTAVISGSFLASTLKLTLVQNN